MRFFHSNVNLGSGSGNNGRDLLMSFSFRHASAYRCLP